MREACALEEQLVMAKVYLYEDSGGSLYLHRQDDATVFANVEIMVPYGATFEQDASEISDGRTVTGDGVMKVPYAEIEPRILDAQVRRIAVWDDGRIHRFAHPGRNGAQYLQSQREMNPAFDNQDRASL
jgi:hypothetical protein